jgi:hypothetical protein
MAHNLGQVQEGSVHSLGSKTLIFKEEHEMGSKQGKSKP